MQTRCLATPLANMRFAASHAVHTVHSLRPCRPMLRCIGNIARNRMARSTQTAWYRSVRLRRIPLGVLTATAHGIDSPLAGPCVPSKAPSSSPRIRVKKARLRRSAAEASATEHGLRKASARRHLRGGNRDTAPLPGPPSPSASATVDDIPWHWPRSTRAPATAARPEENARHTP